MNLRGNARRRLRLQKIVTLLTASEGIAVEEMCSSFGVSPSTIRRDLQVLETHRLVRREHGNVILLEPLFYQAFSSDPSFQEQVRKESAEKRRIGLAAAELIRDGDTIAISAGSTTTQVARSIPLDRSVTLFTNAVNMAMEFNRRNNLVIALTGGIMRGSWFSLIGPEAIEVAQRKICDTLFLGVGGLSIESGLTDFHLEKAAVNRVFWERSKRKIVVADHTKFGIVAPNVVGNLTLVETIITGVEVSDEVAQPFLDRGIKVVRV